MPERPATFRDLVTRLAKEERVPADLAFQMIEAESSGRQDATGTPVDGQRARGFFQLMPDAAFDEGVDREDPEQNIRGGIRYIRRQLDAAKGNPREALMRYHGGGDPANWGPQTQAYADGILAALKRGPAQATPAAPAAAAAPSAPGKPAVLPPIDQRGRGPTSRFLADKIKPVGLIGTAPTPPDPLLFEPPAGIDPTVGSRREERALKGGVRYRQDIRPEVEQWEAERQKFVGEPPTLPPWVQTSRESTFLAGTMLGGIKGAEMGGPTPQGKLLGGMAGAGIGATSALLSEEGLEEAARQLGARGMPPRPTLPEVLSRSGLTATAAMTSEAAGQAMNAGAQLSAAPFKGSLRPDAQEIINTFKVQGKPSPILNPTGEKSLVLPSEVSTSLPLAIGQNVVEGALFGGSPMAALKRQRQQVAEEMALGELASMNPALPPGTPTPKLGTRTLGQNMREGWKTAQARWRTVENKLWEKFKPLARDIPAGTKPLDDFALATIEEGERARVGPHIGVRMAEAVAELAGPAPQAPGTPPLALPPGRVVGFGQPQPPTALQVAAAAAKRPPPATPRTADQLRVTVQDLGRYLGRLQKRAETDTSVLAEKAFVEQLWLRAKESLDDTLARSNPEAHQLWLKAVEVSRLGHEKYLNKSVTQLMRKNPEKLLGAVMTPNNSTGVLAVQKAVGPKVWRQVKVEGLRQVIERNRVKGEIDWGKLLEDLNGKKGIGEDTLNAMYPDGQAQRIVDLAQKMQRLKLRPAGDIGKLGTTMIQGTGAASMVLGGGYALFAGAFPPKVAAALTIPYVLAKVMSSPVGLKWLSEGLQLGPRTAAATRGGSALAARKLEQWLEQEMQDENLGQPPPEVRLKIDELRTPLHTEPLQIP